MLKDATAMLLISFQNANNAGPWNTEKELFTPKQPTFHTKDQNNTFQSKSKQRDATEILFSPKRFDFFQINLCCLNKYNATSAALFRLHQNLFDNARLHCRSRAWVCVRVRDSPGSSFSAAASC